MGRRYPRIEEEQKTFVQGQRDGLGRWAQDKGVEGIRQNCKERKQISLDGYPTGIFGEAEEG